MRKFGYWLADKLMSRGYLDGDIEDIKHEWYDYGFEDGYNHCIDELIATRKGKVDEECKYTTQETETSFLKLRKHL